MYSKSGSHFLDLLDMNYNLAELDITEVRKGGGKASSANILANEQEPAILNLEGFGPRRAAAISTVLPIP